MKQSMQLKLGQQITLTPQLQQAIHLLQLSTLDLQQEIQQALETNPLLELGEEGEDPDDIVSNQEQSGNHIEAMLSAFELKDKKKVSEDSIDFEVTDTIPVELPVDSLWEDIYPQTSVVKSATSDDLNLEQIQETENSLRDYLRWQMNLTPLTEIDRAIAVAVIDSIDDDGYLKSSLEDILASVKLDDTTAIDIADVTVALHQVQSFDPPGVAARDLQECLLLQLKQLPRQIAWRETAITIISDHIHILANREYKLLMKKLKLSKENLASVVKLIQSLDPRPGRKLSSIDTAYVVPDVIVRKEADRWLVELNPDVIPNVRVNQAYANLVQRADSSRDNQYLRNNLQEARWFVKSLQNRHETLLRVATCIVEQQRDFFEYGVEAMKPLILHNVADLIGMHHSTISRITTQKYMHTPIGVFELKYFFSSHVNTTNGGECSSTAIRALIKKVIAKEDPKKPLSDNKIASILQQQGINVARRTVAKYRETMVIPSSSERKSLF